MAEREHGNTEENGRMRRSEKRGFRGFCLRHRFSPAAMVMMMVVAAALLLMGTLGGVSTVLHLTTKTSSLGLRDIGELATQAGYYTNVQSVTGAREVWGWQVPFTQSRYIFSYDGVIKAGVDFGAVEWHVNELTKKITVHLPEVAILSNEIDENSLMVYDETKNVFTPLSLDDVSQSRIEMKKEAEASAVKNGLLENARTNAEMLIRGFLAGTYDLSVYEIVFE